MELRQLRYFLGVASTGSIAAAARKLHIAQPALSRQIAALEDACGVRLFNRMPRGVALTREGEELRVRAADLLAQAAALKSQVQGATLGMAGTLRIGVMPGYSWLPPLGEAIAQLQRTAAAARISLEPGLSSPQLEALRRRELDAGIVAWRSPLDPSITGRPIYGDRMVVALPRTCPVANRRGRLKLRDLARETFVMFPRERSPAHYDTLKRAFLAAGIEPAQCRIESSDMPTIIGLVAAGLGCAVVPESFERQCPVNVVLREAEGLDISFSVELVWRSDADDPLLQNFIRGWPDAG
jgi:DNA-binding transcriptional LysR family regulator